MHRVSLRTGLEKYIVADAKTDEMLTTTRSREKERANSTSLSPVSYAGLGEKRALMEN